MGLDERRISRRRYLGLSLGVVSASLLAACAPAAQAPAKPADTKPAESKPAEAKPAQAAPTAAQPATAADATFDWKQFSGETLNILFLKHPWATAVQQNLPKFTELTGIKVNFEDLPEIQGRQKLVVEFAGGGGNIDAFQGSLHVEKVQFSKSGWYLPLNDLIADKKLLSPEFDWNDTAEPGKQAATLSDGKIIGLPMFVDVSIMAYRKDILQQKGISVPKDLAELETAIKAVHNPPEVYGWASRGLKNANMTQWPCQFFNFGGQYVDGSGKATLNSPAGEQALDWYARMDREYGPPGIVNFNWYEVTAAFLQGQVAFMQDGINFFTQYEDETKSRVKGNVGYTLVPAGPSGQVPPTYTSAIAISSKTRKPEPTFLFAQWATGKTMGVDAQLAGVGVARLSTWEDPQVKQKQLMPQDWVDSFQQGNRIGRPGLPEIASVTQYRDEVGALFQGAIEGGSPKQIIDQANTVFQAILDNER